ALKVLPKKHLSSPDAVARFQHEVKAAARLTHQHIVTAYDADEAAGMHYLVMEYVEGQDLSAIVKANGPLNVAQGVDYVVQAARGLEHAHSQGVIHRDVKPSNLLLDQRGVVKILDMGLARMDNPLAGPDSGEGLTATGSIMGTVEFMSPEQALDTAQADARSDIYSLGYTLYYLLSGKKPYDGDTAMKKLVAHRDAPIPSLLQVRPEASADLEAVYRKMVAKNPANRYASMREAREALEAVQAGRRPLGGAGPASPVPVKARLAEWPHDRPVSRQKAKAARSKTPLIAAGAIVVLLLVVGAWMMPAMLSRGPGKQLPAADSPQSALARPGSDKPSPPATSTKPVAAARAAAPTGLPMGPAPIDAAAGVPSRVDPQHVDRALNDPTTESADPFMLGADSDSVADPAAESAPPADPALERKAAEWIINVGGKVVVEFSNHSRMPKGVADLPAEPFTVAGVQLQKLRRINDQSLANLDGLSHLCRICLDDTAITDAAAKRLAMHSSIVLLMVSRTSFSDEGLAQLATLTHLSTFRANDTKITDRGAQSLARHKQLAELYLANTAITDAGVALLSELPLKYCFLNGTRVTDAGLKHLHDCKTLATLGVSQTAVGDAGLAQIADLPLLGRLQIRDTRITPHSMTTLAGMTSLIDLKLSNPPISKVDYEQLRRALPNCKIELFPADPAAHATSPELAGARPESSNRMAVPAESEQETALGLVKDVFGGELSQAKKPEEKAALAEKLVKQAQESRDDPSAVYAMLDVARNLAIDSAAARLLV
ncbi:MAG TPA: protein kinase, partial [Pirellulales bacterium]|nr:protein kinase [Pirellulales bacterium]